MAYNISWQGRSAMTVVYSGKTGTHEVLEAVKVQHGDERFDFLKRVLHDFTAIESCSIDENALMEIDARGAGAAFTNPSFKIAVVTERQDVIDMVDKFRKCGLSAYPMQVFPSADKAAAWLEA